MSDIEKVKNHLAEETGLATVSTTQADGRVLSSVVNCGIVEHPIKGETCVAFVSSGKAARLKHIDRGSQVTISIRRGWTWSSVTGHADLIRFENLPEKMEKEKKKKYPLYYLAFCMALITGGFYFIKNKVRPQPVPIQPTF